MLNDLISWLYTFAQTYGYLGSFILSVLSNLILFVPIPYLLIVFWLSAIFDPWVLGLVSALGATLGKVIVYYIGSGGRKILKEEQRRRLKFAKLIIEKYAAFAIFIMAATPLQDDILYLPLGMMRFDLFTFFIYCSLGKIVLTLVVSLGGYYSVTWITYLLGGEGVWATILTIAFVVGSVYLTVKVDWEKLFYRFFSKSKGSKE